MVQEEAISFSKQYTKFSFNSIPLMILQVAGSEASELSARAVKAGKSLSAGSCESTAVSVQKARQQ
jgi:hypothetical protein